MSRRTCDECAACDECIGHRTYMYRSGPQNQTSATRHDPDRTHAWPGTQRTERHRGGPICDMVKLEGPMHSIYLNIFGACSGPCAACMWWWGHRAELVAGRRSTSARGTTVPPPVPLPPRPPRSGSRSSSSLSPRFGSTTLNTCARFHAPGHVPPRLR